MARALSAASRVNLIIGVLVVALAGVFWTQRSYTTPYGGTLPDPVMIVLAVLGLALAVLGLLGREVGSSSDQDLERLPVARLAISVAALAGWIFTLPYLGYGVGGIIFFVLVAFLTRSERPTWKGILLDVAVAAATVLIFNYLFTEFLYVRLPTLGF